MVMVRYAHTFLVCCCVDVVVARRYHLYSAAHTHTHEWSQKRTLRSWPVLSRKASAFGLDLARDFIQTSHRDW